MQPRTIVKRAIDLQKYDTVVGTVGGIDLMVSGFVDQVSVIDDGDKVQIDYIGGTHVVRDEDYPLQVIAKPQAE